MSLPLHSELASRRNTLGLMAAAAARRGEHVRAYGLLMERYAFNTALWLYYKGRTSSSAPQIETYARDMQEANAYAARALAFLNSDPTVTVSTSGEYLKA